MGARQLWAIGVAGGALILLTACGGSGSAGSKVTTTTTVTATQPEVPQAGVVPNVVGLNHQLAQDTMQAAGYYNLREEDATGQHRLLINDRDWVVVKQEPKAGTHAGPNTQIVLSSKKIGEQRVAPRSG